MTSSPLALAEMTRDQTGTVVELRGGKDLTRRLEALGLRVGVSITMSAPPYLRGPVTVRIGNAQVALGFGMAGKIMVEPT